MLTPKFSLSQDTKFLFVEIHAPFIKISEADCYVTDDEFYFHAQPYYLRLHLPGEVVDDEHSTSQSQYDANSGQLTVRLLKKSQGEWFEGLDMLTRLLTPKTRKAVLEGVEVMTTSGHVDSKAENEVTCVDDEQIEAEHNFDWFVEQQVHAEEEDVILGPKYGFAKRKSNILKDVSSIMTLMLDIKNPDHVPMNERRILRLQQETEAFNAEHYLADYFDNEIIQENISFHFDDLVCENVHLSQKEQDQLTALPFREYLVEKSELKCVYLGLVDLVYAYSYNYRFTNGMENVESDWTICKLSATLSWLDYFDNIKDVIISCARRSLCFPLFRNWKLFIRVLEDVKVIFKNGKRSVLKCLLGIHSILSRSESRYPLNDLYVTDYCVWLQGADPVQIKSIAESLQKLQFSKSDIGLNLEAMEQEANELMLSENDGDNKETIQNIDALSSTLSNIVNIKETNESDSDDEVSEETDSDTCSSSSKEDDASFCGCMMHLTVMMVFRGSAEILGFGLEEEFPRFPRFRWLPRLQLNKRAMIRGVLRNENSTTCGRDDNFIDLR
ncbi:protein shq1 homolog [Plakobranchus ocellatus]|uniref:Protein SHQ1 homolog n=1 Tax=Plakobranchus ocellatus TaxID=259542 RepID=A0AAV4C0T1_9GAST|nr:protein shq1 homolog [Plakobranchus ocellatus]